MLKRGAIDFSVNGILYFMRTDPGPQLSLSPKLAGIMRLLRCLIPLPHTISCSNEESARETTNFRCSHGKSGSIQLLMIVVLL